MNNRIRIRWNAVTGFVPVDWEVFTKPRKMRDGRLVLTGKLSNESYGFEPSEWLMLPEEPAEPWKIYMMTWTFHWKEQKEITRVMLRAPNVQAVWDLVNNHRDLAAGMDSVVEEVGTALIDEFPKVLMYSKETVNDC